MRLVVIVMLLPAMALLACAPHAAQSLPDTLAGRRVRVELVRQERHVEGFVPGQQLRGLVLVSSPDSLRLQLHPATTPLSIAAAGVRRIDVSRGVSPSATALRRGFGGAVFWAAIGSTGEDEFGGGSWENSLIWAAGGLVTGVISGLLFPEEQWKRVFRR